MGLGYYLDLDFWLVLGYCLGGLDCGGGLVSGVCGCLWSGFFVGWCNILFWGLVVALGGFCA